MYFLTPSTIEVPPSGDKEAKICLVGEAPGKVEEQKKRPFCGPAGSLLESCLHSAGLTRAECYITNFLKTRPKNNNISPYFHKNKFTDIGEKAREELIEELKEIGSNIIVAIGTTAYMALLPSEETVRSISSIRGYILPSRAGKKMLPTIHPSAILHGGPAVWRFYLTADLRKAKEHSNTKDLCYTEPKILELSFFETLSRLRMMKKEKNPIAFDIECSNDTVSYISFACSAETAFSISFYKRFSLGQEATIWREIASLLEDPEIPKIGQNILFDIQFLAHKMGIVTRGKIYDTMIAHSISYPESNKNLAFLASIYINCPYWKDLVKFSQEKKDA